MVESLQEWMQDLRRALRRKGEERLTVMIIPHGQERIFSLQLNWFMILFLAGTAILAVTLAFYGIYLRTAQSREILRLRELYGANFSQALHLKETAVENRKLHLELSANLEQAALSIGFPDSEINEISEDSKADQLARAELDRDRNQDDHLSPRAGYLPPVAALKQLRWSIQLRQALRDSVRDAIDGGIGLYSEMPLGRPFRDLEIFNDTSPFGLREDPVTRGNLEFHPGYDMAGVEGTPVAATGRGVVYRVFLDPGYGRAIVVRHGSGFFAMYAHLSRSYVQVGEAVSRGQQIGALGRTGRATGPHLHYEIWIGESDRVDPKPFLCSLDFSTERCRAFHRAERL
ncbi:MAG: M23 family metallopeptidase [Leptospirales bacterium]|nr:M23 family metallopeptidase [Leptospirales bacterium]